MREYRADAETADSPGLHATLRRIAFLAVLRRGTDQLLTVVDQLHQLPTLPAMEVGLAADYRGAADQLASRLLLEPTVVWGDTTGHFKAPAVALSGMHRREARLFFLRGVPKALLPWRWVNPTEIQELEVRLEIPNLAIMVEGYIAGWIPEGLVTLE